MFDFPQKKRPFGRFINYLPQLHCGIGIGRCLALIIAPVRGSSRVQRKIRGQTRPHLEQVVIAIWLTFYFSDCHHFPMDNTMQLVLEYFTVFEGVLLLQALCTADGELYIVINTPILLTILKPSLYDWVFTFLADRNLVRFV